jgi:DNA topoisomerase II
MAATSSMDQKYKKHELRDHIYQIPDTYIGSVEPTQLETYLFDEETKRMNKRTITYVPGLYKIFDEIIVNALDHGMRLKADIKAKKDDVRPLKAIRIDIDQETGMVEVMNDGDGIDIEEHPAHKVPIPQLIFGELLTSTNYDPNEEKLWGGKNGYGAKLTNIFSKEFTVETVDHRRKKIYTQSFYDNMKRFDKPTIKASTKAPFTRIRFMPDYTRFGMRKLSSDMYELFKKRAMDACASSDHTVSITFNGTKLDMKSFEKYAELYVGTKEERPRATESCDRWEIVATFSDNGQFEQVSLVNGILTGRGGKHVEYITNQITKRLSEMASAKTKKDIKPQYIKDNLMVFVKALIVNPSFDTQTKDSLTTAISKFGSKCELSDKFFSALYKTGITEKAISLTDFHDTKKLTKTDGKKTSRVFVPKLDDANWAGTKKSADCTLIVTEGDSAKTMAIAGLSVVGRDKYGVFPLRGKILNVKDAQMKKILENEEITNIKKILGLQHGKEYTDASQLRYGRIMVMCDQDHDGSHIKGLLFNLFQSLFPSLFHLPGFITSMLTPIIKATSSSGETVSFYSITDFEKWKEVLESSSSGVRGWRFKYYKGLGTSKESEAKEYFRELKITEYDHHGQPSDEALDLAFNKKRADDRKEWLMRYNRDIVLDYKKTKIPYEEFIHKELIHFSNRDLERSINHLCDGLKESTRKILFGCFKRRLYKDEIKVAQLAAYISEVSSYHHGEASLQQAITGLAQVFVGTNNINLLVPNGQFGTRVQGGQDAASPRYIYTVLSSLAKTVFREEDAAVLKYLDDDGQIVEPEYYIPIVPMILINGGLGIGTGFSTNVPNHNPSDVINWCEKMVSALDKDVGAIDTKEQLQAACATVQRVKLSEIRPWYLGFKGTISQHKEGSYISKGMYSWIDDVTVEITELPIGTWTDDYKEFLANMVANNSPFLKDFESHYTAKNVRFLLKLHVGAREALDDKAFATEFKLASTKNLSMNNIHLYSADGAVQRYTDTTEVARAWACVRIVKYFERKQHQLKTMEHEHKLISAKVKFIQDIIDGNIVVNNKKLTEVETQLRAAKYPTFKEEGEVGDSSGGYNYLTRMPIYQLTFEKKKALEKEADDLKMAIDALRAKAIQHIWRDELMEFKDAWELHKQTIEEEYDADRTNRPSASKTAPKRRTTPKK